MHTVSLYSYIVRRINLFAFQNFIKKITKLSFRSEVYTIRPVKESFVCGNIAKIVR